MERAQIPRGVGAGLVLSASLIIATAIATIFCALAAPATASAAECTDTWAGPPEGSWTEPADWSTGKVPTASTVACVELGSSVDNWGSSAVGVLRGEGRVSLLSGELEVADPASTSDIADLTLEGDGTLTGPGTLDVTSSLTMKEAGGRMTGSGQTVLAPGATGHLEVDERGAAELEERTLVNEGTFDAAGGHLILSHGAVIENRGTLEANGQPRPLGLFESGPGGESRIVNTGTFEKTEGTGETVIDAPVENLTTVVATTGWLSLKGGGSTVGSTVIFGSGGGEVSVNESFLFEGRFEGNPTVYGAIARGVEGKGAELRLAAGTLTVGGAPSEFSGLTLEGNGTLTGPGTIRLSESLTMKEAGGRMTGSGRTVVAAGATGHLQVGASEAAEIEERTLVNEGTFRASGGHLILGDGSVIENRGVTEANGQGGPGGLFETGTGPAPRIVNTGTFEKTEGTGETTVEVPFESPGSIVRKSGELLIADPITTPASAATPDQACKQAGDPVDCASGNFTETQADLEIGGRGVGLDLVRTYSAQAAASGSTGIFGHGWTDSFGERLSTQEGGATETLTEASGETVPFTRAGAAWAAPGWSRDELTGSAGSGFTLTLPDRTEEAFSGPGRLESVTDRDGNATTLGYDGDGRLETITDPVGRTITLTYDGEGLVESAEDPMGHVVHYAYESGNLKSVTLPGESGPNWRFGYDGSHRMTSMTNGRGGVLRNEYNFSNQVVSQTDPVGRTLTWAYSGFHTKITNRATGAVTDEWFDSDNQPTSITHGFGTGSEAAETFTYTTAGLLAGRSDGDGDTTTYGYDAEGDRTSERNAEGDETRWAFDVGHELIGETDPGGETATISRDADGDPETVSRPAPESKTQTVHYTYGPHGEVESMTDPLGATWTYGYDRYGDRTSETDPEGDERTWTYDEDSRLISSVSPRGHGAGAEPARFTTTIERDAQGRPIKVTDPLGGATERTYDADGDLKSVIDPDGRETRFTYDLDDEPTLVEEPEGVLEETRYDGSGQIASLTNDDGDRTTYVRNILEQPVEIIDPLERKTVQTFDAAGNLLTKTDPDGRTTTYDYDKANRLKEISYSAEPGQDATYAYNEDGRPTSMVDSTGESTWEYDQLGRLTHTKDGHGETVSWSYNLGNEPVGLTYPNGRSISRAYDKTGRLDSVTDWLGHTTSFSYNRDSAPTATTFPVGTGDLDEYAWDRADRMSGVTMKRGAETLASLAYSRDPAGQLEFLVGKGLPGAEEESFTYDEDERLTKAGSDTATTTTTPTTS
jgi:YD repeat-containing protein